MLYNSAVLPAHLGLQPRQQIRLSQQRTWQEKATQRLPRENYKRQSNLLNADLTYKSYAPGGRVRRTNGRLRQEASERIGIKSLGKDTDILVLRDLPEAASQQIAKGDSPDITTTEKITNSVTQAEIEQLVAKQRSPRQDEVMAAIKELKPVEEVVSSAKFDLGIRRLVNGFRTSQLKEFLRQNRMPSHRAPNHDLQVKTATYRNFATIAKDEWRADTTVVGAPAAEVDKRKMKLLRKAQIANSIMRDAWQIRNEAEAETSGLVTLRLTPDQWMLLQSRDASDLFSAMRSRRFFRNSRLEADRDKNALLVIGPRAEANGIADMIVSAYADTASTALSLQHVFSKPIANTLSALGLTAENDVLLRIMQETKTCIVYDAKRQSLRLHAFRTDRIDHAKRLLMALVNAQNRASVSTVCMEPRADCVPVPLYVTTATNAQSLAYRLSAPHNASSTASHASIATSTNDDKLKAEILSINKAHSTTTVTTLSSAKGDGSYWHTHKSRLPWHATFGLITQSGDNVVTERSTAAATPETADNIANASGQDTTLQTQFHATAPHLPNLLKHYTKTTDGSGGSQRLLIRLIPWPFERGGERASHAYPQIDLELEMASAHDNDTSHSRETDLPSSAGMRLTSMQALLRTRTVHVACPAASRDVRLQRHDVLDVDLDKALCDSELSDFIKQIAQSSSESDLHFPAGVTLKLSTWSASSKTGASPAKTSPKANLRQVQYLVAGWEKRETLRFIYQDNKETQRHRAEVINVDGGTLGGRRTELRLCLLSSDNNAIVSKAKSTKSSAVLGDLLDVTFDIVRIMDDTSQNQQNAAL